MILDAGRVAELGDRETLAGDPGSRFSRLVRARSGEVFA
jgi:hypothetical protein